MPKEDIEKLVWLYRAGIRAFDEDMGKFFSFLKEKGIYDRSLIIITSDHGEEFREHGRFIHSQTYDETIAVPLLVKFPNNEYSGSVIDEGLIESIDLLPTIVHYLGISEPSYVQGQSLLPLIEGESSGKKFVLSQNQNERRRFALRSTQYKLIFDYDSQEAELYDLAADRGEQVNLAEQAPERMAELLASLTQRIEDNRLLRTALATDGHRKTNVLSDAELERLRSLGYLQ
jgi:arylsulfatase A-like enzyme